MKLSGFQIEFLGKLLACNYVKSTCSCYQQLIIEERVSNCAMGYQKCGPKVHRFPLSDFLDITVNSCL